jgi:hypothetical protein
MSEAQDVYDEIVKEYLDKKYDVKNILTDEEMDTYSSQNIHIGIIALVKSGYKMTNHYLEETFNMLSSYKLPRETGMISLSHLNISPDDKKKVNIFIKESIKNGGLVKIINEFIIPDLSYVICEYLQEPLFNVKLVTGGSIINTQCIYNFPHQFIKQPIPMCVLPYSSLFIQIESITDINLQIIISKHNIWLTDKDRRKLYNGNIKIPNYGALVGGGGIGRM